VLLFTYDYLTAGGMNKIFKTKPLFSFTCLTFGIIK